MFWDDVIKINGIVKFNKNGIVKKNDTMEKSFYGTVKKANGFKTINHHSSNKTVVLK